MRLHDEFRRRHRERFGGRERLFASPGRVNIIGEHTDYNEGFVLPIAIDRYSLVAMSENDSRVLTVYSEAFDETATIALDADFERRGSWVDYVAGVTAAVGAQTAFSHGADISIGGDLPLGAGLSSSAALELSFALALYALGGVEPDPRQIASAGSSAEHEFVGIRSGVMDQLVCALGVAGSALLIDCRSLAATPVALPEGAAIAVCDTMVKHALASSEYNRRRAECEEGVRILQGYGMQIRALRDLSPRDFEEIQSVLETPVRERCRHVVFENQRTLDAVDAIGRNDLNALGALLNESHASLRDFYEVSCPELDTVVNVAQAVQGVYGARMTGGGFGGAALALLRPEAFPDLRAALQTHYYGLSAREGQVFLVQAVSGAKAME